MKKYAAIVIALMLTVSLSACGPAKDTASVPAAEAEQQEESVKNTAENIKEPSAPANTPEGAEETVSNEKTPEPEIPEEITDEAGVEVEPESTEACEEAVESPINEDELPAEGAEVSGTPEDTGYEAAGTYSLAAVEENGEITYAGTPDMRSTMILKEDGTGTLTFNEDTTVIEKWTAEGTMFEMFYDEHGAADGTIDNGIIILDPIDSDDILYFYTQEGADIEEAFSADRESFILEE